MKRAQIDLLIEAGFVVLMIAVAFVVVWSVLNEVHKIALIGINVTHPVIKYNG